MLDSSIFGLDKETVLKIIKKVSQKIRTANESVFEPYGIQLSNKNLSEIIGKIMEKTAADILTKKVNYQVRNAKTDAEPDLFFNKINKAIEIKVTSTETSWTGGEFSKRPFEYLLISWGGRNFDEFFVGFTHLEHADWKSNMSNNYYGPSYSAKNLYEKKEKTIFIGSFKISPKGSVKLLREKISVT